MSLKKLSLSFIGVFALGFSCLAAGAWGEEPSSDILIKGGAAAEGTLIDKSVYVDGSVYENADHDVKIMRIGLSYGDTAVTEASFINCSGEGFAIGHYNADREFEELAAVDESRVTVLLAAGGEGWHILLDEIYPSREKADAGALAYGGFSAEIDGEFRVLYGSFSSRDEAVRIRDRYKLPGQAYTEAGMGIKIVSQRSGDVLYSAPEGAEDIALLALSAGENSLTEYQENRYRGGFECRLYDGAMLTVINCVGLEDYVKGVIPYEMSYAWPYEALKAQAVCARTYGVYNQDHYPEYGFDLTDDTESQVYRGTLEANGTSDAAVDETAGELVRYRGQICRIYYFASDGGATEDGLNVFGEDLPYLAGKRDPFEQAVDYSIKNWTAWRSAGELSRRLNKRGYDIGEIERIETELSDTGNVIALRYFDRDGNELYIGGRDCYTSIGLNNCRFAIEQHEDDFEFYGSGWGHNCGMSQWGANAMASVYGYDYQDIIRFYFTGAYVA